MKIDDVRELHGHWFRNADANTVKALSKIIRDKGYVFDPIVCLETGEVINGRHRYLAAKKVGLENIPAVKVSPDKFDRLEQKFDLEEISERVLNQ